MSFRPQWRAWLVGAGLLLAAPPAAWCDEPAANPAPAVGDPVELEDAPEKLETPSDEAKQDRLHAATLFAQGRISSQRGKYPEALSKYERAARYDENSKTILEEIVPLAAKLSRLDEAARYAALALEKGAEVEPRTLQGLAFHLSQQQETQKWKEARVLLKKLWEMRKAALGPDGQPDDDTVLAQLELGRITFLLEDFTVSAEAFTTVRGVLEKRDKSTVSDALKKMLFENPDQSYRLLGEAFVRGGQPDAAEAMFRKADELKPEPETLAYHLAQVAAAKGQMVEAQTFLDEYLKAKSAEAGAEPYKLLADLIKKQTADEKEAQKQLLDRLQKLYADDPANAGLAYFAAGKFLAAERLEEAEKIYLEQLTLNPATEATAGLIDVYRKQQNVEKLLDTLSQAIADDGTFGNYDDQITPLAEDAALVEKLIALAREKHKQVPDGLGEGTALAVGTLALAAKKIDVANEFMPLAEKREKSAAGEVLTAWGLGLFVNEEYAQAVEIFQRAIDEQVEPDNDAAFYFYLANSLSFADRPDEALTAALQAAQLRPDNPRFEGRVAWINYRAHRYGAAERAYLELLEKIEEDYSSDEMRSLVRESKLVLSNICVQQDRHADGVEWLEQVLDEFPADVGAQNDLGYLWSEKGEHLERSLRMVQAAVAAEPENAAYLDSLAWALFRLDRASEALPHLEKAVELEAADVDGVILDHLGDVYLKLDQKDKAQDAWRRAVAAFEKEEDAEGAAKTQKKITP